MSDDTEEWCKIWKKTKLLFWKWQEFGEFWSELWRVSKTCTLIGPFCAKYMFVLKVTEELSSMILKSHAKFDEKLTCGLENDMNLAHFHQNIWTCQNCYFHGILLSEVENTRANNLQRLCVMTLKNDKKSEEELTCCSKTDMRKLTNFNSNTQKSEKLALWWAACGQKYKVLQLRK